MEQPVKRFKSTKELHVADIATSVDHIAESIQSVGQSYAEILKINRAVVIYLRNAEKREKEIDLERSIGDSEDSSIRD